MSTTQYIESGENELGNDKFYMSVVDNPCEAVKQKCDDLVNKMLSGKEISESVAIFLVEKIFQTFITS